MSVVQLDEGDLKGGLLGLVVALVEIVKETLRLEAVRRMEGGTLTEAEVERLGEALIDIEEAIERLKVEQGVAEAVKAVREGLDRAVDDLLAEVMLPLEQMR